MTMRYGLEVVVAVVLGFTVVWGATHYRFPLARAGAAVLEQVHYITRHVSCGV